ncbi:asparagine synthase (glutamine-hydrolyzing) [Tsuneonella troitsensis]|uniref:asparagine synthase (glutamine-hydrolyzing) n=1 Tax=Tsuneonella troitsensis TaxID=292222 RepID=UPI00070B5177|nr:asparagine synthase (glutamine-hydrolyzing) [Tsuneonella troitsensis]
MCGVAGVLHLDGEPASPVAVEAMAKAVRHRGPDGEGQWCEGPVGLGHRRLAIIDLSPLGRQPMISADGRLIISYNGEVYNFRELRTELEAMGYAFRSDTDSEVVLNALHAWGEAALSRFNGMFALALWDRSARTLTLARDRYGIKPLYWAHFGDTSLFGSEQKAIMAHPAARPALDRSALVEYFTFQNIFTDRTLLEQVRMLPPATVATIGLDKGASLTQRSYWDYRFREPDGPVDPRAYREELDRLLRQAVTRQLVSDVELGSYLSGGMDSGTLTALGARQFPNMKSFTCGFDISSASGLELAFDERAKAEAMSALFRTEHYEMVLKAGDMERCLPDLAWAIEEPRVGQSYPNFYAAKLASKFVKVVLSGAGGDELFGGYPWRYYRAVNCESFDEYVDHYYGFWHRLIAYEDTEALFSPIGDAAKDVDPRQIFRGVFATHDNDLDRPEDFINHSLYFEAKTFLHGLFVVEDKLSMAHGLESRVPFMDNDLVEFAMACPVGLKLNNLAEVIRIDENEPADKQSAYFQKTKDGKQILRDVMANYIPAEITGAAKQGFSAPDASWFRGDSIEFVRRKLFNSNSPLYDFLDRATVQRIVQRHLDGEENRRLFIWSLLNVDAWMERTL